MVVKGDEHAYLLPSWMEVKNWECCHFKYLYCQFTKFEIKVWNSFCVRWSQVLVFLGHGALTEYTVTSLTLLWALWTWLYCLYLVTGGRPCCYYTVTCCIRFQEESSVIIVTLLGIIVMVRDNHKKTSDIFFLLWCKKQKYYHQCILRSW